MRNSAIFLFLFLVLGSCKNSSTPTESMATYETPLYQEPHRPQYHFTPREKWMNDPNGLVYYKGVYHLFYQYYPEDIVWGPMHWGHATSTDLVHWEHKPIALFPDQHGYIFSGSAVVDFENTSGLGTKENPAMIAIFTYHLMEGEKAGKTDYQTQGIAYSLDGGDSWEMYAENPVIGNPGIKDFRDPKVFWNEKTNAWSMLLVAGDHLQIWGSNNLIDWEKQSEFGKNQGAHGGVWECPDLFSFTDQATGTEKWVLFISINPGAPNGGSGTQYFVGDFDGKTFVSDQKEDQWVDWGTDNYAGVTYNHTPDGSRLFIGWMSNWLYAQNTPTERWRSAMTLPRILSLKDVQGVPTLFSTPAPAWNALGNDNEGKDVSIAAGQSIVTYSEDLNQSKIDFIWDGSDMSLSFVNQKQEHLSIHLDPENQQMSIDRSASGLVDFQEDFKTIQTGPIGDLPHRDIPVTIFLDQSSVEIFMNNGQKVMTAQFFNNLAFNQLKIENNTAENHVYRGLKITPIQSIWDAE